jgi:Zn-dependent protease with chaperone function
MGRGELADARQCRDCGGELAGGANPSTAEDTALCDRCAEAPAGSALPSRLGLATRRVALRGLELAYHAGVGIGAALLFVLGGFVPVSRRWLADEVSSWPDVIETLGGVRVDTRSADPDADLGPVLARGDAPVLFTEVDEIARKVGARPPQQIRLTYLPCCGVVAWKRSRALILGLPLLDVLTRSELRAVLAHELAHLARGDATRSAQRVRFVQCLGLALDEPRRKPGGPLALWARACRRTAATLLEPISRGQEARADRIAASLAGGDATASALFKVAIVQPLFKEVLEYYDPNDSDVPNLYAFFRAFWARLPVSIHTSLRQQLLVSGGRASTDGAHPPLLDRLAIVQSYPPRSFSAADRAPAASSLSDLEALEQMLHNRLFAASGIEPSVFHRAGS